MSKKINCCKKWFTPAMKKDDTAYNTTKKSWFGKVYHWFVLAAGLAMLGAFLIPEIQRADQNPDLSYLAPNSKVLKTKAPAIRISGIDFVSDHVRDLHQKLSYQMDFICSERADDVIFAFQFGSNMNNKIRLRDDHIFALCRPGSTLVVGNAEIIDKSEDFVMCQEEYAGILNQFKRPNEVTIKGIDIDTWEVIEFTTQNSKEACIVQHAIDILESKWV